MPRLWWRAHSSSWFIRLIRLVEQEVGGQLLILIACEVRLNDLIPLKPETAQLYKC